MTRQDQSVDTGGTAYQAGRDVVIQQGISPAQMTEIMLAMAKQLSVFQEQARQIADERIGAFQEQILKRFAEPNRANPDAFRDPDFQYLLGDAQEAAARSGDEAIRDTLVDIIARRSLEVTRNRLAITLNDAATRAANLTTNEFSALSLVYLLRYTIDNSIGSFDLLCGYIRKKLIPFTTNVSREASSFWHIQAQSCGSIEMTEMDLNAIFKKNYGGVLGKGFDRKQLEDHLPDGKKDALNTLLLPCVHDGSKLQPAAINFSVLKEKAVNTGLTEGELTNVWSMFEGTMTDVNGMLTAAIPELSVLYDVWQNTQLKNLSLTSTGIAIGHANVSRVVGFDAALDVWIK